MNGNLTRVDLPKEKADQAYFLQTITEDRSGGMWVSFGDSLYRLADGVWTPYGGRQDLPKTGVVIEFTDTLGRVWFGYTNNTLAVLDGDRVQVFGSNDGLRVGNVTAIYGRGSEIWIGGEFGLQQFDRGRFHSIKAVDEQWLRGISGIVEAANGDLWLNGLGGIFHVRRSELSEALRNTGTMGVLNARDFLIDSDRFSGYERSQLGPNYARDGVNGHQFEFSNYQTVNGVAVPFSISETARGQALFTIQLNQVTFNSDLADSDFVAIGCELILNGGATK